MINTSPSKLSDLVKDSVIYAIGRGGTQIVAFLLLPIYTRYLSVQSFAQIEIITASANFILTIIGLNITSGIARYYYDTDNSKEVKKRNITAVLTLIILCVPSIIIINAHNVYLSNLLNLNSVQSFSYIPLLFIALLLNQFQLFLFQIRRKPKHFSLINILNVIAVSCLSIFFVVIKMQGLDGYMKGRILGLFVVATIGFFFQWKEFLEIPSYYELKKLLKYSLPSLPGQIFQKLKVLIERQVILIYISSAVLGNYSITLKLLLPLTFISESFRLSWVGFVSSTVKQNNNRNLYSKTLSGYTYLISILSIPLILFAKEIISLFIGKNFELAYEPFSWLLFNTILVGLLPIVNVGLSISEKMKYMSYGTIISGILVISSYFLITPYFEIWGLLFSQTIGIIVLLGITYHYSNKFFKVGYEFKKIASFLLFIITVSVVTHLLDHSDLKLTSTLTSKLILLILTLFLKFYLFPKDFKMLHNFIKQSLKSHKP